MNCIEEEEDEHLFVFTLLSSSDSSSTLGISAEGKFYYCLPESAVVVELGGMEFLRTMSLTLKRRGELIPLSTKTNSRGSPSPLPSIVRVSEQRMRKNNSICKKSREKGREYSQSLLMKVCALKLDLSSLII